MDEKSKPSTPDVKDAAQTTQNATPDAAAPDASAAPPKVAATQTAQATQAQAQAHGHGHTHGHIHETPAAAAAPAGAAAAAAIDPEQEKKKRKKLLLILLLFLILIIAALAIVFGVLNKNVYDTKASSISYANQSYEDIVKELNEKTEASRLWISVANTFRVKSDGTAYAQTSDGTPVSVLDNIDRNTKDIKYTIYLDSDDGTEGKQIYESGLISPGQSIVNPELDISGISTGSHQVTATAQGYDPESHLATGGKVSAQVTMIVE